jgi:hypothetical protein
MFGREGNWCRKRSAGRRLRDRHVYADELSKHATARGRLVKKRMGEQAVVRVNGCRTEI